MLRLRGHYTGHTRLAPGRFLLTKAVKIRAQEWPKVEKP